MRVTHGFFHGRINTGIWRKSIIELRYFSTIVGRAHVHCRHSSSIIFRRRVLLRTRSIIISHTLTPDTLNATLEKTVFIRRPRLRNLHCRRTDSPSLIRSIRRQAHVFFRWFFQKSHFFRRRPNDRGEYFDFRIVMYSETFE